MDDFEQRLGDVKGSLDQLFSDLERFDLSIFNDLYADLEAKMDDASGPGGWRDFDSSLDDTNRDLEQTMEKVRTLHEVDEELHFLPRPSACKQWAEPSTEEDSSRFLPSKVNRKLAKIEGRYIGSRLKALLPTRPQ
jgi:hypothetical protein